MILQGRQQIFVESTSEKLMGNVAEVANCINVAMDVHRLNSAEVEYLINYKNGNQPILTKEKTIRPEINHKLLVNHAQMATRNIVGYFLGTPIQYIQSTSEKKDNIDKLNRYVAFEDKSSVDQEIGEYQSICGTAFRCIFTDGAFEDEVPFENKSLNPATTFVAYTNTVSEKPLFGCYYFDIYNGVELKGRKYYCYTDFGRFEFITDSSLFVKEEDLVGFEEYSIGGVPIIEYPNNVWRIGDWELQMGLMNSINDLNSSRLDDIDQIIQSLLVFVNADVDEDTYANMRASGVISLKNTTNFPTSIQNIVNNLDQTGVHQFSEQLEKYLYALIGIPDRDNRSGGGGDTGQAVELRDGWADLEIVARTKEQSFKRSERQALKIMLTILNNKEDSGLTLLDIDIKFTRNKNSNLLVKTQGYMNLIRTKTLSPADCLTIVDLVSDVNEYIKRGEDFWGDEFAGKAPEQEEVDPTLIEQNPDGTPIEKKVEPDKKPKEEPVKPPVEKNK